MRISAAVAVAFATLVSTVYAVPVIDDELLSPVSEPFDIEKRQVSASGSASVSVSVSVSVNAVLVSNYGQVRDHTSKINDTLGTINENSTWVQKNNAMMIIRSELNAIGVVLGAGTTQIGTLGGQLGGDTITIANSAIAIVNEILYTLQYAVIKLGPGVLMVLGIIINNVLSILAGMLLSVNILAHGSLTIVHSSLNASVSTFSSANLSLIQGLKYLIGY